MQIRFNFNENVYIFLGENAQKYKEMRAFSCIFMKMHKNSFLRIGLALSKGLFLRKSNK